MTYNVLVTDDVRLYLRTLERKSRELCLESLTALADEPYPDGEDETRAELAIDGERVFQQLISRVHVAIYVVLEEDAEVRVVDMMARSEAEKLLDVPGRPVSSE